MSDFPRTRYAKSGDVNIAYQVVGDGPIDLIEVPGFISNVELMADVRDRMIRVDVTLAPGSRPPARRSRRPCYRRRGLAQAAHPAGC